VVYLSQPPFNNLQYVSGEDLITKGKFKSDQGLRSFPWCQLGGLFVATSFSFSYFIIQRKRFATLKLYEDRILNLQTLFCGICE